MPSATNVVACVAAPLMRFVAPSAPSTSRVHCSRVCRTRFVPPSGFLTLLTVCSSTDFPALFHAGALMEFLPFRAFPSLGAVTPFGVRCLHAVGLQDRSLYHRANPAARGLLRRRPRGTSRRFANHRDARSRTPTQPGRAGSTPRLCSPRRVRCATSRGEAGGRPDALLGFSPIKDLQPRLRAPVQAPQLLPRTTAGRPGHPRSEDRQLPCA
jgi:hypothetical protein